MVPRARAEPIPTPLTEADFIGRFERAEPRFDVLAAEVDASRADVVSAGRRENPSLTVDREEVFDSGDGLPEHIVRLSLPIDLSGGRGRRIAAAEKGVAATRSEVAFERFVLLVDALAIYHDAAFARLRVQTLAEGRAALARAVQIVRARKSAGDASGYDLSRVELELGAYDDLLADAETELATARRRLATLVGQPETAFDAADPLVLPEAPPPDAAVQRADLLAARLHAEQAEREAAAASRSWVPGLVLTGGMKSTDLGDGVALGYVVGLGIELPIFDRGQGAAAAANARRRSWLARAREIERHAGSAVAVARDELARRIAQGRRFEQSQVARVADLVRRAEASYREGDRPIVELLDAHRMARDVLLRHLEIRRGAKLAQLALARARGHR